VVNNPTFPQTMARVHHVGISVDDVDRSLAFWKGFLGIEPRFHKVINGPYLSKITGYDNISLDACWIDLPGGIVLEILNYLADEKAPNDDATANPGNVHICIETTDIQALFNRAISCGAKPVGSGPIDVSEGPNAGARGCYVRDPDGITLELLQFP